MLDVSTVRRASSVAQLLLGLLNSEDTPQLFLSLSCVSAARIHLSRCSAIHAGTALAGHCPCSWISATLDLFSFVLWSSFSAMDMKRADLLRWIQDFCSALVLRCAALTNFYIAYVVTAGVHCFILVFVRHRSLLWLRDLRYRSHNPFLPFSRVLFSYFLQTNAGVGLQYVCILLFSVMHFRCM